MFGIQAHASDVSDIGQRQGTGSCAVNVREAVFHRKAGFTGEPVKSVVGVGWACEQDRSLVKAEDGPVSRSLNRPLSTRISMLLARARLPPDLVTWLAFALGLVAGLLLASGQGRAGALVTHAASVLDGVDGELARLQLRASPR